MYVRIVIADVAEFTNPDLTNVVTPVDHSELELLLKQTKYDPTRTKFLVNGFKYGFRLEYEGNRNVRQTAPNLKFTVGNKFELWDKMMNEVKLKRFAGPFKKPPFTYFIQSPVGLVPKDGGRKTRLIFHLSYPRTGTVPKSVNANTNPGKCKVKYQDCA